MAILRAMTASNQLNARGPEREGAKRFFTGKDVLRYIPDVEDWDGYGLIAETTARNVVKMAHKANIVLDYDDAQVLAGDIERMAEAAEYPKERSYQEGIARLLTSHGADYGAHYLSDDFIVELQDMAQEYPSLELAIGNYYSVRELLQHMQSNSDPMPSVKRAVERSIEVAKDKKAYVEALDGDSEVSEAFLTGLTDKIILHVMTRMPDAADTSLAEASKAFLEVEALYPLTAMYASQYVVRKLLYATTDDARRRATEAVAQCESLARSLMRDGLSEQAAVHRATILAHGDTRRLSTIRNGEGVDRFTRTHSGAAVRSGREVEARKQGAIDRGLIDPKRDAAVAQLGIVYRDALYDIDESDINDDQKITYYEQLRTMRDSWDSFTRRFEDVFGDKMSQNARNLFNITVVRGSLYAMKYGIDHPETPQVVSMGSKQVAVTMDMRKLMLANALLADGLEGCDKIEVHRTGEATEHDNVELGLVDGTNGQTMLLTKARRAPAHTYVEHGSSPRINIINGVSGLSPSSVASEREQNALSIRFDLDDDGQLRLDIGGKTDNPNTPDFLVAQMISLGLWYYAQIHGGEASDYHTDIQPMSEDEFAAVVERFRAAVRIDGTALNVPFAPRPASLQDQRAGQIHIVRQPEPARKPAA